MVSEVIESQTASDAEVAAAQAEAVETLQREEIKGEVAGQNELGALKPMQYRVSPADQQSWVMVWEMKLDMDGQPFGTPTRAPRGQLGLWLQKRRADGGPRFITEQPARIAAAPQFPCLQQDCEKRAYTRQDIVDHVRNVHPREANLYSKMLDEIMEQAASDNPRIAELRQTYLNQKERGLRSVEVMEADPPVQQKLDLTLGTPVVTSLGIKPETGCASCDWTFKEDWSERQQAQFLMAHIRHAHKEEL